MSHRHVICERGLKKLTTYRVWEFPNELTISDPSKFGYQRKMFVDLVGDSLNTKDQGTLNVIKHCIWKDVQRMK